MLTVSSDNSGVALVYSGDRPGRAVVCHYENHGHGVIETWPVVDNGRAVYLPVDPQADTPGLVGELNRLLGHAAIMRDMAVTASTVADLPPEEIKLPEGP